MTQKLQSHRLSYQRLDFTFHGINSNRLYFVVEVIDFRYHPKYATNNMVYKLERSKNGIAFMRISASQFPSQIPQIRDRLTHEYSTNLFEVMLIIVSKKFVIKTDVIVLTGEPRT